MCWRYNILHSYHLPAPPVQRVAALLPGEARGPAFGVAARAVLLLRHREGQQAAKGREPRQQAAIISIPISN